MLGGAGSDTLNGDNGFNGADTLNGGADHDTLTGGAGNDQFVFDLAPNAADSDIITDFAQGQDQFVFDNAVFTAIGADGALAANAFYAGAAAHDADDRVIFNSATGVVSYDADGLGGIDAVEIAHMSNGVQLTHTDFSII